MIVLIRMQRQLVTNANLLFNYLPKNINFTFQGKGEEANSKTLFNNTEPWFNTVHIATKCVFKINNKSTKVISQ